MTENKQVTIDAAAAAPGVDTAIRAALATEPAKAAAEVPAVHAKAEVPAEIGSLPPNAQSGSFYAMFKECYRMTGELIKCEAVPKLWRENQGTLAYGMAFAACVGEPWPVFLQHCYPVYGKVRAEGKYVHTLIDKYGPYPDGLQVEAPRGEGDARAVTVSGKRANGKIDKLTFTIGEAKQAGWIYKRPDRNGAESNWWLKLPDQMLIYRTISLFCDAYCPGARLGLQMVEEGHDIDGVTVIKRTRAASEINATLENVRTK